MESRPADVESLLADAGRLGASDLGFDPDDAGALRAVMRLDGVREIIGAIPPARAAAAIARLKALASLPAYILDEPQDGRIDGRPWGIPGDLRLAVIPTVRGPRAALRLPALGALPAPEGLGLPAAALATLRGWLRRSDGLVVLTGPTGSGKTTTIHSLLVELAHERPDRQVLTIEDPVERRLADVIQVEVRPRPGWTLDGALTAALRHDPDVIVVGEIRDAASATACLRAALTGHLVVTTIHAGRAGEVVPRLLDMGLPADLLLPPLVGIAAQRLVRRRHDVCAGEGCAGCRGGWLGRLLLLELLEVGADERAAWRRNEMPPISPNLEDQAAALVAARRTTTDEVKRVLA